MKFLYKTSILLYWIVARVLATFQPKAKLFVQGRKGLLIQIKTALAIERRARIWFHCSSLGEFEQARPLMESIRKEYPHYALILTFFSPSGYVVRQDYKGADYVFYLPMDSESNAKLFLQFVQPVFAVFVKYDLWYFYLNELSKNNIPCFLIDAIFRQQQGYFKWYGGIQRQMLQMLTVIFVQNEASKKLLQSINVNNSIIAGDTRFDRVVTIAHNTTDIDAIAQLAKQYKLLIAGSTWANDEYLLAQFLKQMPQDWKLIIVPHEVDAERILEIEKIFKHQTTRWTKWGKNELPSRVLIFDKIGFLSTLYRYATIAWIGGGLSKNGIHNVLEAAVYGLPCTFGPEYQKYEEAVQLVQLNAAFSCNDALSFNNLFCQLTDDAAYYKMTSNTARNYVLTQAGATKQILDYLEAKNWLRIL